MSLSGRGRNAFALNHLMWSCPVATTDFDGRTTLPWSLPNLFPRPSLSLFLSLLPSPSLLPDLSLRCLYPSYFPLEALS
jgi:hypothetical protein